MGVKHSLLADAICVRDFYQRCANYTEMGAQPAVGHSSFAVLYSPVPNGKTDDHDISGAAGYMTLVVGIRARDGIVLIADGRRSRSEYGSRVIMSETQRKIYGFGRYGLGVAGFEGTIEALLHDLRKGDRLGRCRSFDEACRVVGDATREFVLEVTRHGGPPPFPAVALLAGYDDDGVTPRMASLGDETAFVRASGRWIGDRTARIAAESLLALLLPACPDDHPPPSVPHAKMLGALAIVAAARVNDGVGRAFSLATVTPDAGYIDCSDEVLGLIAASCDVAERMREVMFQDGAKRVLSTI